jgi:hypothetical protein
MERSALFNVFSVVAPTSQYRQSILQTLKGTRSTPNENPNLLENTGPKTYFIIPPVLK